MSYRSDYPTEPIGRGNPYHRCALCGRSVPDINDDVGRHNAWCEYRQAIEMHGQWPAPEGSCPSQEEHHNA